MATPLEDRDPEKAAFFLDLYQKAKAAYNNDDYSPVKSENMLSESWSAMCDHMDIEMVRLGFEFGRIYERLGVVI